MDSTNHEALAMPSTPREESVSSKYVTKKSRKAKTLPYSIKSKYIEPQRSADSSTTNSRKASENEEQSRNSRTTLDSEMGAPPVISATPTQEVIENAFETKEYSPKEKVELMEDLPVQELTYNTRALSKNSWTYELEKFEKHALLIFNQENINGYEKPRLGTEKDVEELKETFSRFGFEVTVKKDLTKEKIMQKLKKFGEQDFTDYGCVAVAVLTHGREFGQISAKDQPYDEQEIINHLKVDTRPFLITKPKLFIIQACRGKEDMKAVDVHQATKKDNDEEVKEAQHYTLPVESDMLILHSSYIGKSSHRHETDGSWFIQSLCSKINQLAATHDLESILTEVKREVAIDKSHEKKNKRTSKTDINKQMPVATSTLIRKLYLRRFGDAPPTAALCTCFLPHYDYMKDCLKHYIEKHTDDHTAKSFYKVASTFNQTVEFNSSKMEMLAAISKHLSCSAPTNSARNKYLYLYKKNH